MTYQLLPPLTDDEYQALREDIAANGVRVPVDVDENMVTLDGHHRRRIADQLEIDCPVRVIGGLSEAQKRAHALAVNIQRRSLTREQKRELIAASLIADPELSDRAHGRRTSSDHKTVGSLRGELEGRGEIPHIGERTDSVGRQQPATKAQPTQLDRVALAVEKYPELEWFAGRGENDRILRNASALDSYTEPELTVRRRALAATIAAEQRADEEPQDEGTGEPDYRALADEMFAAVNKAARLVAKYDGANTVAAAISSVGRPTADLWSTGYQHFARRLDEMAAASTPKMRRVK